MRWYLLLFYCVFLITLFLLPSYRVFIRLGVNPFRFRKAQTAINYVGKTYKVISFIAFSVIFVNAAFPDAMAYLNPISFLENEYTSWVEFGLLHFSFIWIFVAQKNMAEEWRIGIDDYNKVKLITKGLFSISRNPVFLGVIMVFVGLFLLVPNTVTTVVLFAGIIVIQVQVRLEEEFLSNELGGEYQEYMKNTPRWLFKIKYHGTSTRTRSSSRTCSPQ